MDKTTRPTTVDAVEAELKAIAADSPMGQKHPTAYMLGVAEAKLAEANREIVRLEATVARLERDIDSLDEQLMGEDA